MIVASRAAISPRRRSVRRRRCRGSRASPPGTNRRAKRSPTANVTYRTPAERGPSGTSSGRDREPARRAGGQRARASPRPSPVERHPRPEPRRAGPRNVAANAARRPPARRPSEPGRRLGGGGPDRAAGPRVAPAGRSGRPIAPLTARRMPPEQSDARPRAAPRRPDAAGPSGGRSSRSPGPGPVAPSSAERTTWARNGSDRIASSVAGGSEPKRDGQAQRRCRRRGPARRSRSGPTPCRSATDSVDDPGPRVLADVAPLVAVEDRRDEEPDRHGQRRAPAATSPGHREVRAHDHERAHQQEHERHAEGAVLVLERRRRVEVAAGQAEEAEDDDRRTAQRRSGRRPTTTPGRTRRRPATNAPRSRHPALHDGVAGPRRRDRVDALAARRRSR